jgi:hypothetical protein
MVAALWTTVNILRKQHASTQNTRVLFNVSAHTETEQESPLYAWRVWSLASEGALPPSRAVVVVMKARTARTYATSGASVPPRPCTPHQPLDVGRDRELLAVVEVRAVVGEDEADVVEVGVVLDLPLVDLLELVGLAVVGAQDLLQGASRDVLLGAAGGRLGAADVLALLHTHDGREPDPRGEDVAW